MNRLLSYLALAAGFVLLILFITVGAGYLNTPPKEPGDDTTIEQLVENAQKYSRAEPITVYEDLAELTVASDFKISDDIRTTLRKSPANLEELKKTLAGIPQVGAVVKTYGKEGTCPPFAFTDDFRQKHLKKAFGENPDPYQTMKCRQQLLKVIQAYNVIRDQDEWSVKVSGEATPPPLWLFKAIGKPTEMANTHPQPRLYLKPAVACFSNEEADALRLLSDYHNSDPFTKSFPKANFPNLYDAEGKIPPLPSAAFKEYRVEMEKVILREREQLFPDGNPPKEYGKAVDEILDRFRAYLATIADLD